jgi:PKD repeat protein
VALSSAGTVDNDGTISTYNWDFGDGSPHENTPNASHSYAPGTFTATLTVTDDDGASSSLAVTIHSTVNQAPTAVASADATVGTAPFTAVFHSTGSVDPDCGYLGHVCPGLTYSWNFGDGSPVDTSASPSHLYAAGSYVATLTVTDNEGATSTASVSIKANVAPTAVASADVTDGDGPLAVQFTGSDSHDDDGSIVAYSWDFGDGSGTVTIADPDHTYAPGQYTATLTVTDNNGITSTSTVAIDVNAKPTSSVSSNVTSAAAGSPVNFTGSAADSDGTFSFAWDFDDGSPSVTNTLTPSHAFTNPGTYHVTLTVTDDRGSVVTSAPRTITVS